LTRLGVDNSKIYKPIETYQTAITIKEISKSKIVFIDKVKGEYSTMWLHGKMEIVGN